MRVKFSAQFNVPAIIIEDGDELPDIIKRAEQDGAVYDNEDGHHFVVQFPGRTPELYTEEALRGSLPINAGT